MTTESRKPTLSPEQELELRESFAEGRKNRERWQRDWAKIRKKYPNHWIAIYDGGETIVGHEAAEEHYDHLHLLEGLNRSSVFRWPPPRKPGTRHVPSVFRRPTE